MAGADRTAIFDSSGLVSLVKSDDQLHSRATAVAEFLAINDWRLLLPYEVLAESLNALGKLVDKPAAVTVGNALMQQYAEHELAFARSEPHIIASALRLLESATGSPSFIDCLVMAMADEQRTAYIFGFDAAFAKNDYRLPGSSES